MGMDRVERGFVVLTITSFIVLIVAVAASAVLGTRRGDMPPYWPGIHSPAALSYSSAGLGFHTYKFADAGR